MYSYLQLYILYITYRNVTFIFKSYIALFDRLIIQTQMYKKELLKSDMTQSWKLTATVLHFIWYHMTHFNDLNPV